MDKTPSCGWISTSRSTARRPTTSRPSSTTRRATTTARAWNPWDANFNNPTPLTYQSDGGRLFIVPILGGSAPRTSRKCRCPPAWRSPRQRWRGAQRAESDGRPTPGHSDRGFPTLSFTYNGIGPSRAVYAQLVDNATGRVVGNIVTRHLSPWTASSTRWRFRWRTSPTLSATGRHHDVADHQLGYRLRAHQRLGFHQHLGRHLDVPTVAQG